LNTHTHTNPNTHISRILSCKQPGLGILMMVAKYYLDTWGPLGSRRVGKAHDVARLTNSKSLRGQVGLTVDIKDFLVGGSSAPFPLMQSLPTHQAQHLLLDARLALQGGAGKGVGVEGGKQGGDVEAGDAVIAAEDGKLVVGEEEVGKGMAPSPPAEDTLGDVKGLLTTALAGAGLPPRQPQFQAFPSFGASAAQRAKHAGARSDDSASDMVFLGVADGYVTAIWYADTATVSVDFLAVSAAATAAMDAAAAAFCSGLEGRYPGTRVTATALSRLPNA
jgi:hypothetical protein